MTSSLPTGQTSLLLQMTQRLALSDAHFRRICQLIYQRAGIVLVEPQAGYGLQPPVA